jgi:hypothetical protein
MHAEKGEGGALQSKSDFFWTEQNLELGGAGRIVVLELLHVLSLFFF